MAASDYNMIMITLLTIVFSEATFLEMMEEVSFESICRQAKIFLLVPFMHINTHSNTLYLAQKIAALSALLILSFNEPL